MASEVVLGRWERGAGVVSEEAECDLSVFEDFARAVNPQLPANHPGSSAPWIRANGYYCVSCGGKRRMTIECRYWPHAGTVVKAVPPERAAEQFGTPTLFRMVCVQCETQYDALVHEGPQGWEVAFFSKERGGLSTPNTLPEVSHYLDQAHRSESVGAMSAAAAMYRSALEMLLFKEGYPNGMLHKKITDLLADTNPPGWRQQVDADYLDALKKIGNAAIHPNDGDISKQATLDRELLVALRAVFSELLDTIYERSAAEAVRKAQLSGAIQALNTPAPQGAAASAPPQSSAPGTSP